MHIGRFVKPATLCHLMSLTLMQACRVDLRPDVDLSHYRELAAAAITTANFTLGDNIFFGSATREIVPPFPVSLAGFGGVFRRLIPPMLQPGNGESGLQVPFQEVDIPPRVKVFLFSSDNPGEMLLLLSIDVVAVTPDMKGKFLARLRKIYPQWQISPEKLILLATHTHSGPAGLSEDPIFDVVAADQYSPRLFSFVENKVVEATADALRSQSPLLSMESSTSPLLGFNASRFPDLAAATDATLTLLRTSKESACITSFAVHPTTRGQHEQKLSADVAGEIERSLETQGAFKSCLFLPGLLGNASIKLKKRSTGQYAEQFSTALLTEHNKSRNEVQKPTISVALKSMRLPPTKVNFDACDASWVDTLASLEILEERSPDSSVAALRLGSATYSLLPAEAAADFPKLVTTKGVIYTSVAQDYLGYLVDEKNYEQSSLESCSTLYPQNLQNIIAQNAQSTLDLVKDP